MTSSSRSLSLRHFQIGWTGLIVFMFAGVALETLHGMKAGFYLDAGNDTRRLMWTLAHAHGTLFSVVHLALGAYFGLFDIASSLRIARASKLSIFGLLSMPLGFALGGIAFYDGDPGIGIFLVPLGAAAWIAAMALMLRHSWTARRLESAEVEVKSTPSPATRRKRRP